MTATKTTTRFLRPSARHFGIAGIAALAASAVVGCGSADGPKAAGSSTAPASAPTSPAATTPAGPTQPFLARTSMRGFNGLVAEGSELGETHFCSGGKVVHAPGSPEIGFPAVNIFRCKDGELRVGFGPGPDQMDNSFQTSDWKILEGTGKYASMTGEGQMVVRFSRAGASDGAETFVGTVSKQ